MRVLLRDGSLGRWRSLTLVTSVEVGGLVGVKQFVCVDVGSFWDVLDLMDSRSFRDVLDLIDPVCNVFNLVQMGICDTNQLTLVSLYWR